MTALIGFSGPLMTQLAETAPESVTSYAMNRENFLDIIKNMKEASKHDHIIFVMGDLKRIQALFKTLSAGHYFGNREKVTMIFADGAKPQWHKPMQQLSVLADQVVLMDQYNGFSGGKVISDMYLPIHKKYWHNDEKKDVDFSFYGSMDIYPERKNTVAYLKESGVNITTGGGAENKFPLDMMAELRRTKITLNFGNCLSGAECYENNYKKFQIKGRVWEAMMAKCVVIEPSNTETRKIFTSDEIVWYEDMKEIPGLVTKLLHDSDYREYVAENAFQKAKQYADPDIYWGRLL